MKFLMKRMEVCLKSFPCENNFSMYSNFIFLEIAFNKDSIMMWHIYIIETLLEAAAAINFEGFLRPILLSKLKEGAATNKVRPMEVKVHDLNLSEHI